jgi:mannose-6-phosphate isomerase-like protein (cupin superfamily)
VVIKGTAKVTRGSDVFILKENESTFIPKGVVHRLENLAATSLEIIEVQTGTYFGEDDIFRLEDEYGRKE